MQLDIKSPATRMLPVRSPLWLTAELGDLPANITQWEITFNEGTTAGDTITIAYRGITQVFTCVSGTPNDSGLQFQQGGTPTTAATNFRNALGRNYYLARDFRIQEGNDPWIVLLTPYDRIPADAYQFPHPQYVYTQLASSPGTRITGSLLVGAINAPENSSCTVLLRGTPDTTMVGTYGGTLLTEIGAPYTGRNDVPFRVDDLLLPFLRPDIPLYDQGAPTPADLTGEPCTKSQMNWWAELVRWSGDPATPTRTEQLGTEASPMRALLAGYPDHDYYGLDAWMEAALTKPGRFLTPRGRTHPVHVSTTQRNWLTFCSDEVLGVGETVHLQARLHTTAGTTTSWSTIYECGYTRKQRRTVPCGWTQLGLSSLVPTGETPDWYEVRIVLIPGAAGIALTEAYRFTLADLDYQELHLLYVNGMGSPSVLRTTGAWTQPLDVLATPTERPSDPLDQMYAGAGFLPSLNAPRLQQAPAGMQRRLVVHSGFHGREAQRAMADCLLSPEWYLADEARLQWLPLRLVKANDPERDRRGGDDEHLFALRLEFELLHAEPMPTQLPGKP